jgi:ketosteroid isomerase-like protein
MAIESAPDVEQHLRKAAEAFRQADSSFVERFTSKHESALLIGSDAHEVAHGYDQIVGLMTSEMEHRSEYPRLDLGTIEAWRDGDVAWATSLGEFQLDEKAGIPSRATAVLHREDGDWKIVNWCFSLAVPNEELNPDSSLVRKVPVAST